MAAALLHSVPGILFALDTPSAVPVTATEAYVKGWFVPQSSDAKELWLSFGEMRVPAFTGLTRPDVARHHRNHPSFKYSGFVVRFRQPSFPAFANLSVRAPQGEIVLAEQIPVPALESETASARRGIENGPTISVLVSIPPDAHPYLVSRAIDSVRQQTYSRWHICCVGRSDAWPENRGRIQWVESPKEITGDYLLFLDYRDELDPYALEEIANVLGAETDLVYTDELEIDFYGNRGSPVVKPDFDPEALLSWNYIGHGATVRRALFSDTVSDSWDALLQVTRKDQRFVRHLAKPLYYKRIGDDETAPLHREKAVAPAISADPGLFPGSLRRRHPVREDTSIAIVLRAEDGVFQQSVLSPLIRTGRARVHYAPTERLDEDVQIFINRPLDTLNHSFIEELVSQALREDCAVVTGISLDRKGRILHSGLRRNSEGLLQDPFAGSSFFAGDLAPELSVVRSVDAISNHFFALKQGVEPRLLASAHSRRLLVTPYAIATFDMMIEDAMHEEEISDPDIKLRQIASERNYLRRELDSAREMLARIDASRCEDLRARIAELETALDAERRVQAEMQDSLSWKLTSPLRRCLRLVRGR